MVVLVLGGGCFDDEDALTTNDNDDAISYNIHDLLNIFGIEIVHQRPRPLLSGFNQEILECVSQVVFFCFTSTSHTLGPFFTHGLEPCARRPGPGTTPANPPLAAGGVP
jgi:hypothetical protein